MRSCPYEGGATRASAWGCPLDCSDVSFACPMRSHRSTSVRCSSDRLLSWRLIVSDIYYDVTTSVGGSGGAQTVQMHISKERAPQHVASRAPPSGRERSSAGA